MKTIFSTLTFLLFFTSWPAMASTHFEATVDANEISEDENLTLTFIVSSDENINVGEPRLPDIDGFELSSNWSSFESSSQFVNGKFQFVRRHIYKYLLTPQRKGTFQIGPAEVIVNGQSLKSQPITVKVVDASQAGGGSQGSRRQQRPGAQQLQMPNGFDDEDEDLFAQILRNRSFNPNGRGGARTLPQNKNEAFFIQVEVDKTKVYVGQQVTASWYLYTTGNIRDFDALKYPDLRGFWKEDLEMATRLNFQSEVVNGVPYNKALLVSYALFPLQPGKKTIDSYKAKATIITNDTGLGMFGIGRPASYTKASHEVPIEVIPLPTEGRPSSFSGAVGSFDVQAQLSATSGKVNQPVSLKIKFQGEGNVKAIELPPLNLPSNMEVYDTKNETKFFKTGQGYKDFEVFLIPRSTGDIVIPPISVGWFDPKLKRYVSKSTPSFTFKALPGDGTSPFTNLPLAGSGASESAPLNIKQDIEFIKTTPVRMVPLKPAEKAVLWFIAFIGVIAWFGFQIYRASRGPESSSVKAHRRAQAKLKSARARLKASDWRGVGTEVTNAVLGVLGEMAGVGGASLEASQLIMRLPKQLRHTQGEKLRKFLSKCEMLSFAPEELVGNQKSESELKSLLKEAEGLIVALMKAEKDQAQGSSEQAVEPSINP